MWWTVCSLTQELVNICSSTEVKEEVLKPWGKKIMKTVNDMAYWFLFLHHTVFGLVVPNVHASKFSLEVLWTFWKWENPTVLIWIRHYLTGHFWDSYISSAVPWSSPSTLHVHSQTKSGNCNSEHTHTHTKKMAVIPSAINLGRDRLATSSGQIYNHEI